MSRKRSAGFTLVEMMVVIVIIGLLAAATIFVLSDRADRAKVKTTQAMISELSKACDEFKLNHNKYPDKLEDLVRMPAYVDNTQWPKGGYVKNIPKDGWGREFIYRVPGTNGQPYDLVSLGQDGRESGEGLDADLWNHDAAKR